VEPAARHQLRPAVCGRFLAPYLNWCSRPTPAAGGYLPIRILARREGAIVRSIDGRTCGPRAVSPDVGEEEELNPGRGVARAIADRLRPATDSRTSIPDYTVADLTPRSAEPRRDGEPTFLMGNLFNVDAREATPDSSATTIPDDLHLPGHGLYLELRYRLWPHRRRQARDC
jgi:hypothetical protein